MKKSSTPQVPKPTRPVAPVRTSPPPANNARATRSASVTTAEKQQALNTNAPPPTAERGVLMSPRIIVDPSLVSTTGDLGTFIEHRGGLWKVAYSGPVYFSDSDEAYLGLIACSGSTTQQGSSVEPTSPVGNCNGTVGEHAYFVCDENRGLLVPAREVVTNNTSPQREGAATALPSNATAPTTTTTTPRSHQDLGSVRSSHDIDLESSLSGLVAGAQSIRRLRDEASPAVSVGSYATPKNPKHQSSASSAVSHCDVSCETDAFLLDALQFSDLQASSPDWLAAKTPLEDVQKHAVQLYQPTCSAARRALDVVEPLLCAEAAWLDERKKVSSALEESIDWGVIAQVTDGPLAQLLGTSSPSGEAEDEVGISHWAQGGVPSRLQAAVDKICSDLRHAMMEPQQCDSAPAPLQRMTLATHRQASVTVQNQLEATLQPLHAYTTLPSVRVDCSATQESANATDDPLFLKAMKDIDHAREQFRRLQFSIESVNHDIDRVLGDGRMDELESLSHARVDLAQRLQQISCSMIAQLPELQTTYVETPRTTLREAVATVRKSLPETKQNLVKQQDTHAADAAERRQLLDARRESFLRDAFQNSNDLSNHVHSVAAAHKYEQDLQEQLRALLKQLSDARVQKYQCVAAMDACVANRVQLFQRYHESAAEGELILCRALEEQRICGAAAHAASGLVNTVGQLSESEEAALMAVQRRLFELETEAHDLHKAAYREVCLATEDLAHRKDQAHRVICDRLDRCRAELEVAMDSTDDSQVTRGLARERNELERAAIELHGDTFAIRSIGASCGGVFEERSLPFLIKCGKEYDDPMNEAKRLTHDRIQKLIGIKEELRTA